MICIIFFEHKFYLLDMLHLKVELQRMDLVRHHFPHYHDAGISHNHTMFRQPIESSFKRIHIDCDKEKRRNNSIQFIDLIYK